MTTIRIDLFADIACPWCYIGEHRLRRALAARPGVEVEWGWRPYQLQPDLPPEGMAWDRFVESRFGGAGRAAPMFERVAALGAEEGIDLGFERMARAPNTRDAHRVVLFAEGVGRQREAAEALFRAHFSEGRDVSDREVLLGVGESAGLDREALAAYLASEEGIEAVRASQAEAAGLGISGVPFFVLDERYGISGAQSAELFGRAIDQVLAERESGGGGE